MKNFMLYGFLAIGLFAGYLLAIIPGRNRDTIPFDKLGYVAGAFVALAAFKWFEGRSHERHLKKWETLRGRGRLRFILAHYIAGRGVLLLLIMSLPVYFIPRITTRSGIVLTLTAVVALCLFGLIGYREWSKCSEEISVRSMKSAAERVGHQQDGITGDGGIA